MSRQIGYFADDGAQDFPELNKCPDCETFFADEHCPICGKRCPQEYRSGNRKPVKRKKRRPSSSGRVQFIPWYHTTAFVILMLIIEPLIGLILTWTSHWRRLWKIVATVAAVVLRYGGVILVTLMMIFFGTVQEPSPVESMSPVEYMEYCETAEADPRSLYGYSHEYAGVDVRLDVTVREVLTKKREYAEENFLTYYFCEAQGTELTYTFLLLDCRVASDAPIRVGDSFSAYGCVSSYQTVHLADGGVAEGVCIELYYAVSYVLTE